MSDEFNDEFNDDFNDEFNTEKSNAEESNEKTGYSFESILAEIKGSAFINGDKRTPPDILQEKADRILKEAAELAPPPPPQPPPLQQQHGQQHGYPPPQTISSATQQTIPTDIHDMGIAAMRSDFEPEFSDSDELPMIITPLEQGTNEQRQEPSVGSFSPSLDLQQTRPILFDQFSESVNDDVNQDTRTFDGGETKRIPGLDDAVIDEHHSESDYFEEEDYEEPQLRDSVRKFAVLCNSVSIRVIPASVITVLMVLITFVYEAGLIVPFGIGYNLNLAAVTLAILLLVVMMLCSDVLVRGVDFLLRGAPNAETLILFSCLFSLISAIFTRVSGAAEMLPFCAVSALSLTFAAHGEKYNLRAMTDTLKTAVGTNEPYGVQAEYNADIDKSVLKKVFNRTDGFYNNLMQPDITEIAYRYAAPGLLIGSLVLTILTIIVRGGVENSLHILSALLAAAAPFSALLSFAIPFVVVVKSTRKTGAAVAGWGGADDICFTDGVCVTDDDLFPPGMLKLSGVKVYDGASPENAIRSTASLVLSSGSGLTGLFEEVLKQQGMSPVNVNNFECHESGIAGIIQGEQVSTGSAAFMNLLGVRVPDDSNMKNAVYTAIDNRLVAMFAIDYKPLPSVQSALISMLKWRIDLFFAMRDFNVTPAMVGQKFKVPFDSFVFIPAKDSYSISDLYSGKPGRMAAVLNREGLNPFAEAITSGRLLKSAAFFATILSVVSAALGVLIMFYMCWTGSFLSASPGNLVIFMLCMMATVLIVCGYVRLKK